jgi:acyl-CoA synthetase (AMP-forming)/AMP-acid ligase II
VTVRLISESNEDVTHLLDTAGEVQVKGPNIFTGYWDDPKTTEKEFVTDEKTGERWFKVSPLHCRLACRGLGGGFGALGRATEGMLTIEMLDRMGWTETDG